MNEMEDEDVIKVITVPGVWHIGDNLEWEFKLSNHVNARIVNFRGRMTAVELRSQVALAYGVDESQTHVRTSYRQIPDKNLSNRVKSVPKYLEMDNDVYEFHGDLLKNSGLNMFVSFEETSPKEIGNPIMFDSDGFEDSEVIAAVERFEEACKKRKRAESDAIRLSNSSCGIIVLPSDCRTSDANFNSGQASEVSIPEVAGGRDVPTLDSVEGEIGTQYSKEFDELARLAEIEHAVLNDNAVLSEEVAEDFPSHTPVGFGLGIEDDREVNPGITDVDVSVFDRNINADSNHVAGDEDACNTEENNDGTDNSPEEENTCTQCSADECRIHSTIPETEDAFVESLHAGQRTDEAYAPDAVHVDDDLAGTESNLDLANTTVYVGRIFECKQDMYMSMSVYAVENTFCFKVQKSDPQRWRAVCVDQSCKWMMYAVSLKGTKKFVVRTTNLLHTCDVASRAKYCQKASARVIAKLMQTKYSDGRKGPRAMELQDIVFQELRVNVSYMKAWYIREIAVASARGSEEASYQFLSIYLHLLNVSNPGSLTDVVTEEGLDGKRQFKYLFMALAASIYGYKFLKKVVVIDGTQLKGKYKGTLVAASGQDGNLHIFPLAFGIVDSENEDSWVWFLQKLSTFVPDNPDLVFVSDRHAAIYCALQKVYPSAKHAACTVHLWRNVKAHFKCEGLANAMSKAARAYTIGDFKYWWEDIKKRSPACCRYLLEIGVQHWTLCYFKGNRYNIMSSNIAESLNHALGKAVDYPIVSMLEYMRTMLMRWFSDRKEHATRCTTRCTPKIEGLLYSRFQQATSCRVRSCSASIFQVNSKHGNVYTVDMEKRSCSCKTFDVLKIPCSHAIAVCMQKKLDVYSLVDTSYTKQTWGRCYEVVIMPLPRPEDIDIPIDVNSAVLSPPAVRRPPGRPPKLRIRSYGEDFAGRSRKPRCGRCSRTGHNRVTCSNPI